MKILLAGRAHVNILLRKTLRPFSENLWLIERRLSESRCPAEDLKNPQYDSNGSGERSFSPI